MQTSMQNEKELKQEAEKECPQKEAKQDHLNKKGFKQAAKTAKRPTGKVKNVSCDCV
jgi:hypothetical protein